MRALFCVLLFFVAASIAVPSLDENSLNEARSNGAVFVKFFAPWCGHCKRMAADWETFAKESESKDWSVAEVDCTQQKPLCSQYGVRGYPTLLFIKGDKAYKHNRPRSVKEFTFFANEAYAFDSTESVDAPKLAGAPAAEAKKEEAPKASSSSSDDTVAVLTDDSFDAHVSSGAHFVKFYAPWCGWCKKLAPVWDQLAKKIPVAKVDCTVHKAVCSKFAVRGYPTLKFIKDGKVYDYSGKREIDAFVEFAEEGHSQQQGKPLP